MSGIKAIETKYKGYRFRSRLEARWAVFFDAIGLKWEYEPEGYELRTKRFDATDPRAPGTEIIVPYLPDFHLPDLGIFVEIKGGKATAYELERCRLLADQTSTAVFLAEGLPYENPGHLFCWDTTESSAGRYENRATFLFHKKSGGVIIHEDRRLAADDRTLFRNGDFGRCIEHATSAPFRPHLYAGAEAARAARFEHGEKP